MTLIPLLTPLHDHLFLAPAVVFVNVSLTEGQRGLDVLKRRLWRPVYG